MQNENLKYIIGANLRFSGSSLQIGCVFVKYDLFNTTNFIQNCIYMNFRINLTQFFLSITRDRKIR